MNGWDLDCPPSLIEHVHIEPLARQVQSGVQHAWSLPVLVAYDNPTLSPVRLPFMTFHRADLTRAGVSGPVRRARGFSWTFPPYRMPASTSHLLEAGALMSGSPSQASGRRGPASRCRSTPGPVPCRVLRVARPGSAQAGRVRLDQRPWASRMGDERSVRRVIFDRPAGPAYTALACGRL